MQSDRLYRLARGLVLTCVALAAVCFYELLSKGIGTPKKAGLWFGLLIASVITGSLAYVAVFYYHSRQSQPSNEKIALEALAAAGQQLARERQQHPTVTNNSSGTPPQSLGGSPSIKR